MAFEKIHGHTIDPSLIKDGTVIDIGCRDFLFASAFPDNFVVCIDPDPTVFNNPEALKYSCWNVAVSNKIGPMKYHRMGEMTCLTELLFLPDHAVEECVSVTMDQVYLQTGKDVDLLKLDCEGAEYLILSDPGFQPIPKQITVEWHHHTCPAIHDKYIDEVLKNLLEHYDWVFASEQDNLFIRR